MLFKSWFDSWSALISAILTVVGWMYVSLCNRSSNRNAALLATRNQARIEISAALKEYQGYLHDIEGPMIPMLNMIRSNASGPGQDRAVSSTLIATEQLENKLKHDPRLGVGGLQVLKGYLPLFPDREGVIVEIQGNQVSIGEHLDQYFERTKQLIKDGLSQQQTLPRQISPEDVGVRFERTKEEKSEIWSQTSIVDDFIEHLNFTVLSDVTGRRKHWTWTGSPEYVSHWGDVGARLYADRHNKPHVRRWDKEE